MPLTKKETPVMNDTEKAIIYLRENVDTPTNTTADVRHLWDNRYRINFWGEKEIKETVQYRKITRKTLGMIKSIYVIVDKVEDGLIHTIIGDK